MEIYTGVNGTIDKKGNKESPNGSTPMMEPTKPDDQNQHADSSNNASIDATFLINGVNNHASIQHPSSEQHTEL